MKKHKNNRPEQQVIGINEDLLNKKLKEEEGADDDSFVPSFLIRSFKESKVNVK